MDNDSQDAAAPRAIEQAAYQHVAAGRLEEAQALYERLCQLDPADANNRYNLGTVLMARKRHAEAEAAFRAALSLRPGHAPTLHNLGMVLKELNRLDEAAECFGQALDLGPSAISHFNLGHVRRRQQRPEDAVEQYRRAVALAPQHAAAHRELGMALYGLQRHGEAEAAYRAALRLKPQSAAVHSGLGTVLSALGRNRDALTHYREALRIAPGTATHYDLATALGRLHENEEAITHYRAALRLDPTHIDAWNNLGNVYRQQGRYAAAAQCYREALRLDPRQLQAQLNMGTVLLDTGQYDAALSHYREAQRLDPENRKARIGEASVYERQGDIERATSLIQPMLDTPPVDADAALAFAAMCRPLDRCPEAVALLQDVLRRDGESLDVHDRVLLHFALGTLLDASADYPEAFKHFSQANALTGRTFDTRAHSAYVDALIDTYSSTYLARAPRSSNPSERPVFIVGMLRSGTSLVEQILASHPGVFGAGELEEMDRIALALPEFLGTTTTYPGCVTQLNTEDCDRLAQRYLDHLTTLGPRDTPRVTDKMPGNFLHLGLIAQLLPRARVIQCLRDPLDTCLSCFFHHFGYGLSYTNSLDHLAAFYLDYRRLMAHWKQVLDIPIFEVRYEELVNDQERVTRALLDFCGLEWDDRCLDFHRTRRAVFTASYDQVRQPLYDRSVGRWRHYAEYLDALKKSLED
jgi:tetratricopeptide (TPR) repeat protein